MEISGQSGIFVGGASGMCRATAQKFAEKGGSVAILDLEKSDGAAAARGGDSGNPAGIAGSFSLGTAAPRSIGVRDSVPCADFGACVDSAPVGVAVGTSLSCSSPATSVDVSSSGVRSGDRAAWGTDTSPCDFPSSAAAGVDARSSGVAAALESRTAVASSCVDS